MNPLAARCNPLGRLFSQKFASPWTTTTLPMANDSEQDMKWMQLALEEASKAPALSEIPIGAVIIREGQILAKAHNHREVLHDPTAHAEILAIRAAASSLGSWRLLATTLYVTVEPCAMCLGAIILARIPRVVFGARDPKAGACGSVFDFSAEPRLNHSVMVTGGVLADESQALIQKFFKEIRETSLMSKPLPPTL